MSVQQPRPKFEVGDWVTWEGQAGKVVERVVKITEPQPGNYVLWTTLNGRTDPQWLFPINQGSVTAERSHAD